MPGTENRSRRAWRETNSLENWRWRVLEVGVLLAATYGVLRRSWSPGDVVENVVLIIVAGVVTLLLVPAIEFGVRWAQVGPRMAEERIPLSELRRVISDDVRRIGPQPISLGGTLAYHGVPFTQKHIAALRTLQANGEVGKVRYRKGFETDTGDDVFDAIVETLKVLDD